ncbi:outer membrane porin GjpA [Mycolicibacter arupensis]|uniref:outer membrane porin GjpA n=1 Tax=Mycolicibacter arupensis TaxID=342002 RepID=UPI003B3B3DC3
MDLTTRPLITAGLTALGVGLIAAAPAAPPPPSIPPPAVQLAAESDFFTLWAEVLDRAFTNAVNLGTELITPPLPILQQVVTNQIGFLQDFLQNPADIFTIVGQMWDNLVAGLSAPFDQPDLSSLDQVQTLAYYSLSALMSSIVPDNPELGQWLLDFSTTDLSGWLIGLAGTVISPWVELSGSIDDIVEAVRDSDWLGALTETLNIPAHMLDGLLNGAGPLDLTSLAQDLDLPVISIRSLELELPGLLSDGGSIFGSVSGLICSFTIPITGGCGVPINMVGSESGPLGSLIDLGHTIAQALGWDGTGNPLDALFDGPVMAELATP